MTKYPNRNGSKNSNWKGGKAPRKCIVCGCVFLAHKCHINRGGGKLCSRKCSDSLRSMAIVGNKNPSWKGGVTPEVIRSRVSKKYEVWRKEVFSRDGYACKKCGDSSGGNLNAHHILGFSKYPELRFSIDNGITLCKNCHKIEHKKRGAK